MVTVSECECAFIMAHYVNHRCYLNMEISARSIKASVEELCMYCKRNKKQKSRFPDIV